MCNDNSMVLGCPCCHEKKHAKQSENTTRMLSVYFATGFDSSYWIDEDEEQAIQDHGNIFNTIIWVGDDQINMKNVTRIRIAKSDTVHKSEVLAIFDLE